MRTTKVVLLSAVAALVAPEARAQQAELKKTFEVGEVLKVRPVLEYRPRVLAHAGRDAAPGGGSAVVTQRIRLGVGLTLFDDVHVRLDAQDVRTWGEELSTVGDDGADGPEIYQAYGELRLLPGNAFRVGRQEIKLDRGRLMWHRNWNDHAQTFDGVTMQQTLGALKTTGFWSRISEDDVFETDEDGNPLRGAPGDHDLFGLHVRSEHLAAFRPSVMVLYDDNRGSTNECLLYGAWIDGEPVENLTYRFEAYHQLGRRPTDDGGRVPVGAFLVAGRAQYAWPELLGLSLAAGVDVYSGDDPSTARAEGFEQMYGARHIYLGDMDLFKNIGRDTGGAGIIDGQAEVGFKPMKGLKVLTTYHHFEATRGDLGQTRFGEEIDLRVDYAFADYFDVRAGGGVFLPGEAMACARRSCGAADSSEWLTYLMARAYY